MAKIIINTICHWKRKTDAKILFNDQVADDSHESVITKSKKRHATFRLILGGLVPTLHVRFSHKF